MIILGCPHCKKGYDGEDITDSVRTPSGSACTCPNCGELISNYMPTRCPDCAEAYYGPLRLVSEVPKNLYSFVCERCGETKTKDLTPRIRMYKRFGLPFVLKDPSDEDD